MDKVLKVATAVVVMLWAGVVFNPSGQAGSTPATAIYALGIATVVVVAWQVIRFFRVRNRTNND